MNNNNREQTISRVTIWGAVGNLVLTAVKLVAGFIGHSAAMVADAIHSLSDLVSDVVVLVLVRVSSKGIDHNHDYGHGKFETLATVLVSLLLLWVGGELIVHSIDEIQHVLVGEQVVAPNRIALWAALVSIVVKEALYWWTALVGKRVNSPAMISNAWHHRTDALSSVASALGIGGAMWLGGRWVILDPIVGGMISIFIIVIAIKMAIPALHELTEGSLPKEIKEQIEQLIVSVDGVDNVHELRTRRNGPIVIISAHIVVNPQMSVHQAHHLTELAEEAVRQAFGNETQITIHIEPDEDAN